MYGGIHKNLRQTVSGNGYMHTGYSLDEMGLFEKWAQSKPP